MAVNHAIARYAVQFQAGAGFDRAQIVLYDEAYQAKAAIYFGSPGIGPVPNARVQGDSIYMYFQMSSLPAIMDLLRNEKPIRAFYVAPTFAGVTTWDEPIGEEEAPAE